MKRIIFLGLVFLLASGAAQAHKSNMGFLEINEQQKAGEYYYTVNWSFTGISLESAPAPAIPQSCVLDSVKRTSRKGTSLGESFNMKCSERLVDKALAFDGDEGKLGQLVLVFNNHEKSIEKFYTSNELPPVVELKDFREESAKPLHASEFFGIGMEHMLLGWDHLLFVISLLLLTGISRRILLTVTGFTLGHSATLGLASFGWVSLPSGPVEALIALSIVYMAAEITRVSRGQYSVFRSYPILVTTGFGLLHGLGFAGALGEISLGQELSLAALLFFNLGIEAAQLIVVGLIAAFVIGVIKADAQLRRTVTAIPASGQVQTALTYAIGTTAGYWFIERASNIL